MLFRRHLGSTGEVNVGPDFLALQPDSTGQHWLLNAGIASHGFNGWIDNGKLVPLQPKNGRKVSEAW